MKKHTITTLLLLKVLITVFSGFVLVSDNPTSSVNFEESVISGADVLAFGPNNTLFIGDSKGAMVYAVQTEAMELSDPVPFNLEDFDLKLAEKLGISPREVVINDMKIHPVSQEAYIAVKKGFKLGAESMVAIVSPMSPEIRFLQLTEENTTEAMINNPASGDLMFWKETPANALTITDIDYNEGFVYVAGLSIGEFASNIRKIPFPFDGSQEAVSGVEIYHAVHTQMETRAPIRTMLFDEVAGESTLIASYTCTPLVTIPTSDITSDNHVVGKTIAELGYGNTPIDILTVVTQQQDGSYAKQLLVTHKNRGGSLIPFESVVEGAQGEGMEGMMAQAPTGLENMIEIPTANVMQIDTQNQMMLSMIRRNMDTGGIDLVSEITGVYLRLSDFISEYDFPDYEYGPGQEFTKQFHDMIKPMEGFPDLVSDEEEN